MSSQVVAVCVPAGVSAGQTIRIDVGGVHHDVQVPAGVAAGATFQVSVPKPTATVVASTVVAGGAGSGLVRTTSGRLVSPAHAPALADLARTQSGNDRLRSELGLQLPPGWEVKTVSGPSTPLAPHLRRSDEALCL